MNVLTFSHRSLSPGVLYSYWLQVASFNGLSPDLSADAAVAPVPVRRYACMAPQHFTSLKVLAQGASPDAFVTIAWEEPLNTGGCPIDGYSVLAGAGSGGALTPIALPAGVNKLPAT
jgi:hypothetical protein